MFVAPTPAESGAEQQVRAARDLDLIEAYRSGSGEAFEELVLVYDQHVRRILARSNVPPGDVEDLAQEVFLRIFQNLHRFRGESSFYTWLYRITLNVFFDHNKKRKRADVRLMRLKDALADASNAGRAGEDPYHACCTTLSHDDLIVAIAALPEAFRTVVALREVHDMSYDEIATRTGISVGTIRSRLFRARARLKKLLRPEAERAAA